LCSLLHYHMYISSTLLTHIVLVLMVLSKFWHQCCPRFFLEGQSNTTSRLLWNPFRTDHFKPLKLEFPILQGCVVLFWSRSYHLLFFWSWGNPLLEDGTSMVYPCLYKIVKETKNMEEKRLLLFIHLSYS
jgi:hypothetical protein